MFLVAKNIELRINFLKQYRVTGLGLSDIPKTAKTLRSTACIQDEFLPILEKFFQLLSILNICSLYLKAQIPQ